MDALDQNIMLRTAAEAVISFHHLYRLLSDIFYLMEPSRASIEKEFRRLISSIVRTFDYFATTLDLQVKVLVVPTKRFAQEKMLITLQDRLKQFLIEYTDNTLMGITLKDMAQISLSKTTLRSHNRSLCEYIKKLEAKNPLSRFDRNKHFLIPDVVVRTLSEVQKENFQKDGVLPNSAHQTYVSACKTEQIPIHPKFRTISKPQVMSAKNQSLPV